MFEIRARLSFPLRLFAGLGSALSETGRPEAAKPLLEKAALLQKEHFGLEHVETARTERCLGMILVALGNAPEAQDILQHALSVFETQLGVALRRQALT